MSLLAPAPSTSRGDIVLQPNYFTSSVYVNALRDDISTLIYRFHEAYSKPSGSVKPFMLFKSIWLSLGWNWMQFKVFDSRSRQTFLDVTLRLFLERTVKTEAPFTRTVALFGFYLFYYTQIKDTAPPLYYVTNIPIPCGTYWCTFQPIRTKDADRLDHYMSLKEMPNALTRADILPLQPYARYVLSCLSKDQVFFILPKSDLYGANPRELPREILTEDDIVASEKRKGRPARREKGKKARLAVEELDRWVSAGDSQAPSDIDKAMSAYQEAKAAALGEGNTLATNDSEGEIVRRLAASYGNSATISLANDAGLGGLT